MSNAYIIIEFLLVSIVSGLVGTAGMTLFMLQVTRSGFTNADMVRAIGSMFTKSLDSALLVGTLLHTISGVIFAMIYILILHFFGTEGFLGTILVGMAIGAAHGYVLSFLLVVSVAEHHPLPQFQEAGMVVAAVHFLGHVIYGILLGAVVATYGYAIP